MNFIQRKKFNKWQKSNPFYNKNISILGDSISTLNGYNPQNYDVFYKDDVCDKSGVCKFEDTWWGEVINFFGARLLVNNSWSGSKVSGSISQSGCSNERTSGLSIGLTKPDIIIVYLGINDWANGINLFIPSDEQQSLCNPFYFFSAYFCMLNNIKLNYPNSEVYCCTLPTSYMSTNKMFSFPHKFSGGRM